MGLEIKTIWDIFGVPQMPWIIRVYILLTLMCVTLILLPGLTFFKFEPALQTDIIKTATDILKIVIGAVIGSLTMASNQKWGNTDQAKSTRDEGD
ncbi:MAG: hypothetical protein E2O38_16850 [Proteobacteria bacterium]|nr:MAG: hypothetical protein E2O38_16850 [Pseudomonadota bacterium]